MLAVLKSSGVSLSALTLMISACAQSEPDAESKVEVGPPPVSLTVLEFGGPNTLFAADDVQNKVYALELAELPDETGNLQSVPYNLVGFGSQLAAIFEVSPFAITYHDLAVHPVTKSAFVSLSMSSDTGDQSALVMVSPLTDTRPRPMASRALERVE